LTFALAKMSWICFERPLLHKDHLFKYLRAPSANAIRTLEEAKTNLCATLNSAQSGALSKALTGTQRDGILPQ
jgi:hypothetical protein